MAALFGTTHGLITSITLVLAAVFFLGGSMFRKNVANDTLSMPFSLFGSTGAGLLVYIIFSQFLPVKWGVAISFIAFIAAGFLIGNIVGDGESSS